MDEERHYMNPARGSHMRGEDEDKGRSGGKSKHPQIHIHSHAKGHTVHIMHGDGRHEEHEHERGDTKGIKQHIDMHLGAGNTGQDHGENDGAGDELAGLGI